MNLISEADNSLQHGIVFKTYRLRGYSLQHGGRHGMLTHIPNGLPLHPNFGGLGAG